MDDNIFRLLCSVQIPQMALRKKRGGWEKLLDSGGVVKGENYPGLQDLFLVCSKTEKFSETE